jgi:hypothetical protein
MIRADSSARNQIRIVPDAGSVLVPARDGGVDHLYRRVSTNASG